MTTLQRTNYAPIKVQQMADYVGSNLYSALRGWTDGPKYLIANTESPAPVLKHANFVGSNTQMLTWVKDFPYSIGTIYVAANKELLRIMCNGRPDLDIQAIPHFFRR